MKRLLAVCVSLVLVLGLATGALALDKMSVQFMETGNVPERGGGTKDWCYIWNHNYDGNWQAWWSSYFDSCCGIKVLIDPYGIYSEPGYTDCDLYMGPLFPFNVESFNMIMWAYAGYLDTAFIDIVFEVDIEELGPIVPVGIIEDTLGNPIDTLAWCPSPGPVIWTSDPFTWTLMDEPGDAYVSGWYMSAIFDTSIWVYEPFFVSFHILNHPFQENPYDVWGYGSDIYQMPYCRTWYYRGCIGQDVWVNHWDHWVSPGGIGQIIVEVDGRPQWNVPVEMGSFEVVPGDMMVTLNWQSMSERNNSHWIIKRDQVEIARVEGQGSKEMPTDYRYVDRNVVNGMTYSYTLEAVNFEGVTEVYGPIMATVVAVPREFSLAQNYPNPFNASTVIRYELASDEHVTLKVYNIDGQEVASLLDTDQKAGRYAVQWTAEGVSSGVYFYTLTAGDFSETKKMVFMK